MYKLDNVNFFGQKKNQIKYMNFKAKCYYKNFTDKQEVSVSQSKHLQIYLGHEC